jgi:hypothetical protein
MVVAIPLVFGLAGQWLGGLALGGILGAELAGAVGYMAGTYLGYALFPQAAGAISMPKVSSYPTQGTYVGSCVPVVLGTARIAGNLVNLGPAIPYTVTHKAEGGKGGMFGGSAPEAEETRYRRSFFIALCHGEATITKAWKGKEEIPLSSFTTFTGDGNSGLSIVIGDQYAKYAKVCGAYFDSYDVGNTDAVPQFTFLVSSNSFVNNDIVFGGAPYLAKSSWMMNNSGVKTADLVDDISDGCKDVEVEPSTFKVYTTKDSQVHKFNPDGSVDTGWAANGVLTLPGNSVVQNLLVDSQENLYVSVGQIGASPVDSLYKYDREANLLWSTYPTSSSTGSSLMRLHPTNGFVYCVCNTGVGSDTKIYWFNQSDGVEQGSLGGTALEWDFDDFDYFYMVTPTGTPPVLYKFFIDGTLIDSTPLPSGTAAPGGLVVVNATPEGNTVLMDDTRIIVSAHNPGSNASHLMYDRNLNLLGYYAGGLGRGVKKAGSKIWGSMSTTKAGEDGTNAVIEFHKPTRSDTKPVFSRGFDPFSGNGDILAALPLSNPLDVEYHLNPADILKKMITDTDWGAGLDSSVIDNATWQAMRTYCYVNNIELSIYMDQRRPLTDWMDVVLSHFSGFVFMSG